MPNPSQTKASEINTELGVSSTAQIRMGNNWVRNVATKTSGTITYGNTRFGINFPGGSLAADTLGGNPGSYTKTYGGGLFGIANTYLYLNAIDIGLGSSAANTILTLYSNGVMKIEVYTQGYGYYPYHRTWLTSGVNSDYTAQMKVYDSVSIGGSSVNSDLALSTDRSWYSGAISGGGTATNYANCGLIIKSSGATLIERPVYFSTSADAY